MLVPFPLELFPFPIPISSPKLLPRPWESIGIPWESHEESYGNPMSMGFPFPCTSLICIAICRGHTSKPFRYGTRSERI